MKKIILFSIVSVILGTEPLINAADEAPENKSVIEDNIAPYPTDYVEKPLNVRGYPIQYQEKPLGFLETPRYHSTEPLNFRNLPPNLNKRPDYRLEKPPGFIELDNHPLANRDPSTKISLEDFWLTNKSSGLYITVDEHPLKSVVYPQKQINKEDVE